MEIFEQFRKEMSLLLKQHPYLKGNLELTIREYRGDYYFEAAIFDNERHLIDTASGRDIDEVIQNFEDNIKNDRAYAGY